MIFGKSFRLSVNCFLLSCQVPSDESIPGGFTVRWNVFKAGREFLPMKKYSRKPESNNVNEPKLV